MTKALKALAALVVVALAAGGIWWLGRATARALPPTVADLEVVHSGVLVSDNATVGSRRLSVGSTVVTDADGRARLRLDDGTTAVLDRDSEIRITEKGLALTRGRSFVVAAEDARTELSILEAKAAVRAIATHWRWPPDMLRMVLRMLGIFTPVFTSAFMVASRIPL